MLRLALVLASFLSFFIGGESTTFTFVNKCGQTVWPGILSNAGSPQLQPTGFELPAASSRALPSPAGWSGRFWARTGCSSSGSTWSCTTGDCGSGQVECNGAGAAPPATLAEFTLASAAGQAAGQDFYDVSLVDGYNLPVLVEAGRGCAVAGCAADLGARCPAELRVGQACKSACDAFGKPEYCCSGVYASPATCRPTAYSQLFKTACPKSYSYAFDDPTSTFTCSVGTDYTITFCPNSGSSLKSPRDSSSSSSSPTSTSTATSSTSSGSTSTSRPAGGMMLADSTWLANLATGDGAPGRRAVSLLLYSFITAMAAYVQLLQP